MKPPKPHVTAAQRSLAGQIGALALHSRVDGREHVKAARRGFLAKFLDQVDPDRVLSESERNRRAEIAVKVHYARMRLQSLKVRQANAAT